MKICKNIFCYVVFFVNVLAMTSCVTETESRGGFKKPTQEGLKHAISLYVQMAYQRLDDKDYEKAMASVQRALEIDKNSPEAITALAVIYEKQGDTEKARNSFQTALNHDDKFSDAYLSYGQFLFNQKEYESACQQFQAAANDDFYPKRAASYFNLAACYKARGDMAQSEAALSRCIGLDPTYFQAIGMLASIQFDKKQYPEAKQLFDRHVQAVRATKRTLSPEALWLGIRLERVFKNPDAEASLVLFLKNNYPYSKEYLEYQNSLKK